MAEAEFDVDDRITNLSLNLEVPKLTDTTAPGNPGFFTSLDMCEGQMVVVGKTSFELGDNSMIAVLTAKIPD